MRTITVNEMAAIVFLDISDQECERQEQYKMLEFGTDLSDAKQELTEHELTLNLSDNQTRKINQGKKRGR